MPEPAGEQPSNWFTRLYNHVDRRVASAALALAHAMPHSVLGVALAFFGALLIWIGPKPAVMLANPLNGLECISPALGRWLNLDCGLAPRILGAGWTSLLNLAAWLVAFILLWVAVWFVARVFISLSSRMLGSDLVRIRDPGDVPRKVLIMGLSPVDPDRAVAEAARWASDPGLYAGPAGPWKARVGAETRAEAAGWQQAARMILAHSAGDRLKVVYVLPSAQTAHLVPAFKAFVETLFGRTIDLRQVTGGDGRPFADESEHGARRQSYDNYRYLREGLLRAVDLAKADFRAEGRGRLWDNQICVDATAGSKLFSIAAAVVAFDRGIDLGYVVASGPNPDEGMVKLYDPRIEFFSAVTNRLVQSTTAAGGSVVAGKLPR
jgi:hypothetical protein